MTLELLEIAQSLRDKIAEKKAYLDVLFELISAPQDFKTEVTSDRGWKHILFVIPKEIVKEEAMRQAEALNKEIEQLEAELERL